MYGVAKALSHAEDTVPSPGNSKVCLNASQVMHSSALMRGIAKVLGHAQEDCRVYHRRAAATR